MIPKITRIVDGTIGLRPSSSLAISLNFYWLLRWRH